MSIGRNNTTLPSGRTLQSVLRACVLIKPSTKSIDTFIIHPHPPLGHFAFPSHLLSNEWSHSLNCWIWKSSANQCVSQTCHTVICHLSHVIYFTFITHFFATNLQVSSLPSLSSKKRSLLKDSPCYPTFSSGSPFFLLPSHPWNSGLYAYFIYLSTCRTASLQVRTTWLPDEIGI